MPITVEKLNYIYQPNTPFEQTALRQISFTINDGEIIGIMGASGSGKSTLLQCLNGLLRPAGGKIILDGIDITKLSARELNQIRRRIALAFQYPEQQIFETRVYDEVAFGPRNLGLDTGEVEKRVQKALIDTGLNYDYFKNKETASLSSGEKRRVSLAGVLALKAPYLLLDEPTAGLDFEGKEALINHLTDINCQYQTTIVLVSHDINQLVSTCSRIIILHEGQLYLEGYPGDLLRNYAALKACGIEVPTFQELIYRLNCRGWDLNDSISSLPEASREIGKKING
ncbi:MAG: ATP-binding cassette domain-containing protein [Syntrophomonadaceae bacterium]|nr:ATP-binding cassette domain-containing protein [Syntrophomonadaceae bacterium]